MRALWKPRRAWHALQRMSFSRSHALHHCYYIVPTPERENDKNVVKVHPVCFDNVAS